MAHAHNDLENPDLSKPVDFHRWIDANKSHLLPPVCNKMLYNAGQLKVMVVGGPNIRNDYHLEAGEELFFQLKGDMVLKVIEHGQHKDIHIKEGEMFVLPGFIPHSPQRFENTAGLVIERERLPEEKDGLMWFKKDSDERIFAEYFHCTNLGVQLVPVIERFQHSAAAKTGEPDPSTKTPPLIVPNPALSTDPPIAYAAYASAHPGVTEPFHKGEFKIQLVNAREKEIALGERCEPGELFYYQRTGHSVLHLNGHSHHLAPHAVFLVPHNTKVKSEHHAHSECLIVRMVPKRP